MSLSGHRWRESKSGEDSHFGHNVATLQSYTSFKVEHRVSIVLSNINAYIYLSYVCIGGCTAVKKRYLL